mmetsp:Transcript_151185/g.275049  ORF Transcript_151185/g.275049 Transcript_151185/m.275049 type:complete len:252 (-) Transcript_151185:375-1130(-)
MVRPQPLQNNAADDGHFFATSMSLRFHLLLFMQRWLLDGHRRNRTTCSSQFESREDETRDENDGQDYCQHERVRRIIRPRFRVRRAVCIHVLFGSTHFEHTSPQEIWCRFIADSTRGQPPAAPTQEVHARRCSDLLRAPRMSAATIRGWVCQAMERKAIVMCQGIPITTSSAWWHHPEPVPITQNTASADKCRNLTWLPIIANIDGISFGSTHYQLADVCVEVNAKHAKILCRAPTDTIDPSSSRRRQLEP